MKKINDFIILILVIFFLSSCTSNSNPKNFSDKELITEVVNLLERDNSAEKGDCWSGFTVAVFEETNDDFSFSRTIEFNGWNFRDICCVNGIKCIWYTSKSYNRILQINDSVNCFNIPSDNPKLTVLSRKYLETIFLNLEKYKWSGTTTKRWERGL